MIDSATNTVVRQYTRLRSQHLKYIDSYLLNILIKIRDNKFNSFCLDLRFFYLDLRDFTILGRQSKQKTVFYLDFRFSHKFLGGVFPL
jgi:hypothetical protein